MSVSALLELYLLTESQSAKATAANTAIGALEKAVSDMYVLTTADTSVDIPFDDTNDLSSRTALRFVYLVLDTGASGAFDVVHPDNRHLFYCLNSSGYTATIKCSGSTGVEIAYGEGAFLYCDGSEIVQLAAGGGGGGATAFLGLTDTPGSWGTEGQIPAINATEDGLEFVDPPSGSGGSEYDLSLYVQGVPDNSEYVFEHVCATPFSLPASLTGSQAYARTTSSSNMAWGIYKNLSLVGTVTFATGSATGTFSFASLQSFAAGDRLTIISNSASESNTLANVSITLKGTKV